MTQKDARSVISRTGGDPRAIERELGLDDGYLKNPQLLEIDDPQGLRVPSGNEPGANEHWIPRGVASGGVHEAVINPTPIGDVRIVPITRSP